MGTTGRIITTNIRVPREDWMQLKAIAAEQGVSANEYISGLLRQTIRYPFRTTAPVAEKPPRTIFDAVRKFASMKYQRKPMGASEDDKIIY